MTKSLNDAYGVEGKNSINISAASNDLNIDSKTSSEKAENEVPQHEEEFLSTQVSNTDNEVDFGSPNVNKITFDFNSRKSKTVSFMDNTSWKRSEKTTQSNSTIKSRKTTKKTKSYTLDKAYFQKLADKKASIEHSKVVTNLDAITKKLQKTNISMKKINHQTTATGSSSTFQIPRAINDINAALNSIEPILNGKRAQTTLLTKEIDEEAKFQIRTMNEIQKQLQEIVVLDKFYSQKVSQMDELRETVKKRNEKPDQEFIELVKQECFYLKPNVSKLFLEKFLSSKECQVNDPLNWQFLLDMADARGRRVEAELLKAEVRLGQAKEGKILKEKAEEMSQMLCDLFDGKNRQ